MNSIIRSGYLALCFAITSTLMAQQTINKKYTLEQCINLALKNSESLTTASLSIEHEKQNKRNSTEIPKTTVVYTQGQFNSIYKYDENITVNQAIPFPTVFTSRHSLANAQIKSSQLNYEASKAELIYNIKNCYYSLLYFKAIHNLLHLEDSIYTAFSEIVITKYNAGKSTLLEKTAAETQVMEIQNQLLESDDDIQTYHLQLATLLNTSVDFDIEDFDLKNNFLVTTIDTSVTLTHPSLQLLEQQVEVSRRLVTLEKAKILPDINVSYFNQTIWGPGNIFGYDYFLTKKDRLQGFIIGVALPLWFHPLHSKVEAAKINVKQTQSNFEYNSTLMHGQYVQAANQYIKYRKSLLYYRKNALSNSKLIIDQATKSYSAAEISYVDYMQIVGHALNIEKNYLDVINQNNQTVLKLQYLLTK